MLNVKNNCLINSDIRSVEVHMYTSHEKKPIVLLIEADPSLRRLLSLGLENRGMHVVEASSPISVPMSDAQQLDLLVLDVDRGIDSDWSLFESVQTHPHFAALPIVLLAWENQADNAVPQSPAITTATQVASVNKPFDARILHRTIDQLLDAQAAKVAAVEARAEEALLATYSAHAAPSMWPIVTAAGLLLAVIGMLLQIAVAVVGILIVVISLLLWTLGTKPAERREVLVSA
jgi:CheY-like chemotaxis protein